MNENLFKYILLVCIFICTMMFFVVTVNMNEVQEQNAEILHTLKLLYNDYEEYD